MIVSIIIDKNRYLLRVIELKYLLSKKSVRVQETFLIGKKRGCYCLHRDEVKHLPSKLNLCVYMHAFSFTLGDSRMLHKT